LQDIEALLDDLDASRVRNGQDVAFDVESRPGIVEAVRPSGRGGVGAVVGLDQEGAPKRIGVSACWSASVAARCSSVVPAWCSVSQRVPATASLGSNVFCCHASNSTLDSLPSGSSVRMTRSNGS
jgi:hypothetical protein